MTFQGVACGELCCELPLQDSNLGHLIQRGPSNPVNFSNLQYSLRARVTRCWSSAFRMPEVAELRSHTRQVLRGAQLCLDSDRSAGS